MAHAAHMTMPAQIEAVFSMPTILAEAILSRKFFKIRNEAKPSMGDTQPASV
jgi:hypothetical protein